MDGWPLVSLDRHPPEEAWVAILKSERAKPSVLSGWKSRHLPADGGGFTPQQMTASGGDAWVPSPIGDGTAFGHDEIELFESGLTEAGEGEGMEIV